MIVIEKDDDKRNEFHISNDQLLYYDEFLTKIVMYGKENLNINGHDYEFNGMLLALITYVHQSTLSFNDAFNKSSLFRLYISFIYYSNKNFDGIFNKLYPTSIKSNNKLSFSQYIVKLFDAWELQ